MAYRNMQRGREAISWNEETVTEQAVTFPVAFKTAPIVLVSLEFDPGGQEPFGGNYLEYLRLLTFSDVTTTGFNIQLGASKNGDGSGFVTWIAWA